MLFTHAHWYRALIVQGGIACAFLFAAPHRTGSPAFGPAVELGRLIPGGVYPIRLYGVVLAVITVGSVVRLWQGSDKARLWSVALTAYWSFWTALWAFGFLFYDGSAIAPFLALGFAWWTSDHARTAP